MQRVVHFTSRFAQLCSSLLIDCCLAFAYSILFCAQLSVAALCVRINHTLFLARSAYPICLYCPCDLSVASTALGTLPSQIVYCFVFVTLVTNISQVLLCYADGMLRMLLPQLRCSALCFEFSKIYSAFYSVCATCRCYAVFI